MNRATITGFDTAMTLLMGRISLLLFLILSLPELSTGIKRKHKAITELYKKPYIENPRRFHGRFAGYPAPPKGKWAYPAKAHPETMGYGPVSPGVESPSYMTGVVLQASPNDVLDSDFWHEGMDWDFPLDPNVCHSLSGLTRGQLHLCHKFPRTTSAAAIGLTMAVKECQKQLKNRRWNCTSLRAHSNNPHAAPIMERGYSETAFVHALTAAGITHSVARACAAGKLATCSCGNVKGKRAWKWSGCHDNTKFGARFSRRFLDVREKAKDILSYTHLYNNEVGRKVVRRNRNVHCKCHGMSGSCEIRTCWKGVPSFREVGEILVEKLDGARSASHEVFGNSDKIGSFKPIRKEISVHSPLLFAEQSPTFCGEDRRLGVTGTLGRTCNRTSGQADSCDALCCGRGYDIIRRKVIRKCHCRFKWCCHVTCKDCIREEWITVCK